MPEEIPEGAPDHPYYHYSSEHQQRIDNNKLYAEKFWNYISYPGDDFSDEFFFPNPPTHLTKAELTPEKVIEEFNRYKAGLLQIRQSDKRNHLSNGGRNLDDFSLYDVYLKGFWDTYSDEYSGTPSGARSTKSVVATAQREQNLALVSDAMDLAGHRPSDLQVPQYTG